MAFGASQVVVYATETPSVSHDATTVVSAPSPVLVIPPRVAAMAKTAVDVATPAALDSKSFFIMFSFPQVESSTAAP
jgi:hypothetical protein